MSRQTTTPIRNLKVMLDSFLPCDPCVLSHIILQPERGNHSTSESDVEGIPGSVQGMDGSSVLIFPQADVIFKGFGSALFCHSFWL